MTLVRYEIGAALRRRRVAQRRSLRDLSGASRVSLGYLSEIERGRKEASSELLAAVCAALELPLWLLLREVSDHLALTSTAGEGALPGVSVDTQPAEHGAEAPPVVRSVPVGLAGALTSLGLPAGTRVADGVDRAA